MLHYAIVSFVIAIVAAVLGFTGIAAGAAGIAKIVAFVFLFGAIMALFMGFGRRNRLARKVAPVRRMRERIN